MKDQTWSAVASPEADTAELADVDVSRMDRFQTETHWPLFARLRRDAPVHYCARSAHGPYWSITRHADIIAVERDYSSFSSSGNVIIGDVPPQFDAPAFATMDPPIHTLERKAVMPALSPRRLARVESEIRREVAEILDGLPRGEPFDWVEHVAVELTRRMAALLFDFPSAEREMLPYWAEVLVSTPGPGAITSSWAERDEVLDEYLKRILDLWHARGSGNGDDVISVLARHPGTASMTEDTKHLLGTITMIAGANEAARGAVSGGVVAFDRFPEEWKKLQADSSLLGNAIEEIVRWQTPITHMRRTVAADLEFRGKWLRKGERVVMWYCSGNRDEAVFSSAHEFRIDRVNAREHVAYGFGIHHCLGRHVAALELRVLWEEILKRFQRIEVSAPPQRILSNFSATFSRLMVRIVE